MKIINKDDQGLIHLQTMIKLAKNDVSHYHLSSRSSRGNRFVPFITDITPLLDDELLLSAEGERRQDRLCDVKYD